jgi:hypothetical protein
MSFVHEWAGKLQYPVEVFAAYLKKNIPFPAPSKAREGEYSVKPLTEDEAIISAAVS